MSRPTDNERRLSGDSDQKSLSSADGSDTTSSSGAPDAALQYASTSDGQLPAGGRLVWVSPDGSLREVVPSELLSPERSIDAPTDLSCSECGSLQSIETVVREHTDCGYVGIAGYLQAVEDGRLVCPKCGVEDETGDQLQVVTTVHSCLRCGSPQDRALGRVDRP
ncbi:hypothetical protein [Haloarchaeobius sp. HRN-SO-5]|uniref:hypothetical protein n=1 Tax=Haloarchaeobius sp. HRN-SO-5 TaxID=3446118 RepID=UPI003EB8BDC9